MKWVEVQDRKAPGSSGKTLACDGQYPRYRVELPPITAGFRVPVVRFWVQWGADDQWRVADALPTNLLGPVLEVVGTLQRFSKKPSRFEDGSVEEASDENWPAEAAPDDFEDDEDEGGEFDLDDDGSPDPVPQGRRWPG